MQQQLNYIMMFYSKGYINQTFLTSTQIVDFHYAKTDSDVLSASKVSNTGNVSLPGMLDIGTSYTNSRIRRNAEVNGHTGYAELKAQSSYDMFVNLQTTRINGGWVYHKIKCHLRPIRLLRVRFFGRWSPGLLNEVRGNVSFDEGSVAILAQGLTFSGSAPGGRPGGVGL